MSESSFETEMKAQRALLNLMDSAREVSRLFKAAKLPSPASLARMLGESIEDANSDFVTMPVSPLKSPEQPQQSHADWIWIDVQELITGNLGLAVLRAEGGGPMTSTELHRRCLDYCPNVNRISLFNACHRLLNKQLRRNDDGLVLMNPEVVPLIYKGRAWGASRNFHMSEVAAFRRMLIRHLLKSSAGGLMTMQIFQNLKQFDFYKFPCSKDLVQDDLEALQREDLAKRVSNSRKWVLS